MAKEYNPQDQGPRRKFVGSGLGTLVALPHQYMDLLRHQCRDLLDHRHRLLDPLLCGDAGLTHEPHS